MSNSYGPRQDASVAVFNQKYAGRNESFRDVSNRVAQTLADDQHHYHAFRKLLLEQRFWPGGRILSTLGTLKNTTPYNCFVSGSIRDSYVSGQGNIMHRATEAAATLRMGGGIGYDFSPLRPEGDKITKLDSSATGPVSFMEIFNAVGKCTSSTGERRGAQMGILRVDHPDIETFIRAKQNTDKLNAFNLSIAITDEFMQAVVDDDEFDLRFQGRVYKTVQASALWELIMRSTWDWGEPGVVFIDRINHYNNLWYCETIAATNPCSEQPLPPFGACLLGYFNMTKYLKPKTVRSLNDAKYEFDHWAFMSDIPIVVRAMDNVVDRALYPLPEQEDEAKSKRRMGLGVMGMANALEACGYVYGSANYINQMSIILEDLKNVSYKTSALLAKEKGSFPLYRSEYLEGQFVKGLNYEVRELIRANGIRNSHLTSIAPTGTTSLCADNVSSGVEPVWDYKVKRAVNMPGGLVVFDVEDYGYRYLGVEGKRALQVTANEHVSVLAAAQKHVDSAISKTCNVSPEMAWEDFKDIYLYAWKHGAKGCTTFTDQGKREGIIKAAGDCDGDACAINVGSDKLVAAE